MINLIFKTVNRFVLLSIALGISAFAANPTLAPGSYNVFSEHDASLQINSTTASNLKLSLGLDFNAPSQMTLTYNSAAKTVNIFGVSSGSGKLGSNNISGNYNLNYTYHDVLAKSGVLTSSGSALDSGTLSGPGISPLTLGKGSKGLEFIKFEMANEFEFHGDLSVLNGKGSKNYGKFNFDVGTPKGPPHTNVPEPTTYLTLGSFLAMAMFAMKRRVARKVKS